MGESPSRLRESTYQEQNTGVAGGGSFRDLTVLLASRQRAQLRRRRTHQVLHEVAALKNRTLSSEVCILLWKDL